jgi:lipopolysaccharide transport system permease protein
MFILNKKYRDIIYFSTEIKLCAEASKTYLSIAWWVLEPIIMMFMYYVVFALILQRRTEDFVVFLLIGLTCWQWFANCITQSMNTIAMNESLINQVDFPKMILPSISIAVVTFKFIFVFLLLCIFLWFYGLTPTVVHFALIPILITQFLFNSACANIIAIIPPFLPDIKFIIKHTIRAGMFLSGVLYDYKTLNEDIHIYFELNPLTQFIDAYRSVLIHGDFPNSSAILIIAAVSLVLYALSYILYAKVEPTLARAILQR